MAIFVVKQLITVLFLNLKTTGDLAMYSFLILAVSSFSRISIGEDFGKLKDVTQRNLHSKLNDCLSTDFRHVLLLSEKS